MMGARLEASQRFSLPSLSVADRSVRTEARTSLGLATLSLFRDPEERAFDGVQKATTTAGFTSAAGVETTWAYHLLRVGAEVRIDAMRNFSDQGGAVLLAPHFGLYMGSFW
jgi:hypothetical protein